VSQLRAFEKRRTGGIKLDYESIDRAAKRIADGLDSCSPISDKGQPPPAYLGLSFTAEAAARDPKSNRRFQVPIIVTTGHGPDRPVSAAPLDAATHMLKVRGGVIYQVQLGLDDTKCLQRRRWRHEIRDVIAHELTHVSDPLTRSPGAQGSVSTATHGYCAYVRQPEEQTAHLNHVRYEITRRKDRYKLRPEELLRKSRVWGNIEPCLTEQMRRRFLKMAARVATRVR